MRRRAFGSIRKLPSGRWQARYTGPDLAEHKAPSTFATKRYAEAWLASEDRLIAAGGWTPPGRRQAVPKSQGATVGEYVERVIERRATRARKPLAPTTADLYRKDYRLELQEPFGGLLLAELTAAKVAEWWDAPTTARTQKGRAYDLLKSVMAEAVEDELIDRNPCRVRGAGKPAPQHKGEALTAQEALRYLQAVPERYRVALMTAAWCGLRSGEVRGLRRGDVDLKARTIRVEQAVSRVRTGPKSFEWRIAPPKTEAGIRTVTMPSVMVEPMRTWLASSSMTGAGGLLFPSFNSPHAPIPDSVLWSAHAKGKAALGRESLKLHDLRRTAATLAAQGGATTAELMRLLGHTTVAVAMVYQVATDARDRERAARLDQQIRDAM